MWDYFIEKIQQNDYKALARCISLVENETDGHEEFLQQLPSNTSSSIIGITGPPGAGKSTLVDALIGALCNDGKKIGILCIDPSSPFNMGALLGDRIRMSNWYNHPQVYIRSLSSKGSLGGLHPHILEIVSVMQAAGFDYIIIETVGVGQSEIEIAGLADTTLVVLVPEAGDEVQTMKAGLMEIADIFVVNKSDREGADTFVKNLRLMLAPVFQQTQWMVPVIKTIASQQQGLDELVRSIKDHQQLQQTSERKFWLLAERAYKIIQQKKMKDISKKNVKTLLTEAADKPGFNLYAFINKNFFS